VGIDIAREIVAKIERAVSGLQICAPMGNVQTALAILDKA